MLIAVVTLFPQDSIRMLSIIHLKLPDMSRSCKCCTPAVPLCVVPWLWSTGNSLDYTVQDMEIMTHHKASVKEMEAAAIAWVASLFNKPMFCIKAVTDIVDGDKPTQEEFLENLHTAAAALQQVLPKVLAFVSGKTLQEL